MISWIDWALTLTNARFKPRGPLSTVSLSSKGWIDLKQVEEFKEWIKRGEPIGGIYVRAQVNAEFVGFAVNADGKIVFRSYASEDEISTVIEAARKILERRKYVQRFVK